MISRSLAELLGWQFMSASFRQPGTYGNLWFTQTFYDGMNPVTTPTDTVSRITVSARNTVGRGNLRNGPARVIDGLPTVTKFFDSLFVQNDVMKFNGDVLNALMEPDSMQMQEQGVFAFNEALAELNRQAVMYKEALLRSIILYHRVNLGADLEILTPTVATNGAITDHASTQISADFGVPDTHRGQINSIFGTAWTDTSISIQEQLDDLDNYCAQNGFQSPRTIVMNQTDFELLKNNTEFKTWAINNTSRPTAVLNGIGTGFEGLFGRNWIFTRSYLNLESGQVAMIPSGTALMYADLNPGWLRAYRGKSLISVDSRNGYGGAEEAFRSFQRVEGVFGYARVQAEPPAVEAHRGDSFGLSFAHPEVWSVKIR